MRYLTDEELLKQVYADPNRTERERELAKRLERALDEQDDYML